LFAAHGQQHPFNSVADPTLNTTAQDIVGAINENAAASGGTVLAQASANTTLLQLTEQYIGLNTSAAVGGFTITLPATPVAGDRVWIKDQEANASVNNVTINGNGNSIDGTGTFTVNIDEQALMIKFAFGEWRIF
jgi:lipopolysaccharide assembly outer membrane protein LptD (OstA)